MSSDKTSLGSNYAQLTTLFSVAERTLDSEVAVAGRFLAALVVLLQYIPPNIFIP